MYKTRLIIFYWATLNSRLPWKIAFSPKLRVAHENFILDISTICLRQNLHSRLDYEQKFQFFKVASIIRYSAWITYQETSTGIKFFFSRIIFYASNIVLSDRCLESGRLERSLIKPVINGRYWSYDALQQLFIASYFAFCPSLDLNKLGIDET